MNLAELAEKSKVLFESSDMNTAPAAAKIFVIMAGSEGIRTKFVGTEYLTLLLEIFPEWGDSLVEEFQAFLVKQRAAPVRPEVRELVMTIGNQVMGEIL